MEVVQDEAQIIEILDGLRDFARANIARKPNPLLYGRDPYCQRVWKRLRTVETIILKEIYERNISLRDINGLEINFKLSLSEAPTSRTYFKIYLSSDFTYFWWLILLHERWNEHMIEIISKNL